MTRSGIVRSVLAGRSKSRVGTLDVEAVKARSPSGQERLRYMGFVRGSVTVMTPRRARGLRNTNTLAMTSLAARPQCNARLVRPNRSAVRGLPSILKQYGLPQG